jgi:hypothetical protein
MNTTISGIPCQAHVVSYQSGSPAQLGGAADYSYPEEYPEIEFSIHDRRGRLAPWLRSKMTDADYSRIEAELLEGLT